MLAGRMNKRITIEQKSVTPDANYGTEVITWVAFASNVPAEVMDVLPSRAEGIVQGIEIAANPSRVRIGWLPGIDSSMRVIIHGEPDRTCQIVAGPVEIGKRNGIELMVTLYST